VAVPLLTLLLGFVFQKWSWGLMDDLQILEAGTGVIDRTVHYFQSSRAFGQFRLVWPAHCGLFYTLFERRPDLFYIFRLFETVVVLLLWGGVAWRVTGRVLALVVLPAVTLSFHYFYDAVFYLSSQELIGLFFLGLALHCFLYNLQGLWRRSDRGGFSWGFYGLGVVFLLGAFNSKEPFVSCGVALGLAHLYAAWAARKHAGQRMAFGVAGGLLLAGTVAYALGLLMFVKSSYTSQYGVNNLAKLRSNVTTWFRKDFLNHVPWLGAALGLTLLNALGGPAKDTAPDRQRRRMGILVGVLLYLGYTGILLPWNTVSYYATPLGVFFALAITVWLTREWPRAPMGVQIGVILMALFLNQLVCQYALTREAAYQNDTRYLMSWLRRNADLLTNETVFSNAMEPADVIPRHVNRRWGTRLTKFWWNLNPNDRIDGARQARFYLYSPRFSSEPPAQLRDWRVLFLSKSWTMYQRPRETPDER